MRIYQSNLFAKAVRKFEKKQKFDLDGQIKEIIQDRSIGSEKKGDLKGVFVLKFKIQSTLYLLSYRMLGKDIELIMIGPHEKYYRDLKIYLKRR